MTPPLDQLHYPPRVAKEWNIPVTTLGTAIKQGRCRSYSLACGTKLVTLWDVMAWVRSESSRARGRPRTWTIPAGAIRAVHDDELT